MCINWWYWLLTEMPTTGDLKSGDSVLLHFTPPPPSLPPFPPSQNVNSPRKRKAHNILFNLFKKS